MQTNYTNREMEKKIKKRRTTTANDRTKRMKNEYKADSKQRILFAI